MRIAGYHAHLTCPSSPPSRSDVEVAKLDDPDLVTLDRRRERNRPARKVNAFDDPEAQTTAGYIGDPAEQIPFEARGQELAVRRRRDRRPRRADDQDTFRASLGVNRSFELDRLAGEQEGTLENQRLEWELQRCRAGKMPRIGPPPHFDPFVIVLAVRLARRLDPDDGHVPIGHPDRRKLASPFDGDNDVRPNGFDLVVFEDSAETHGPDRWCR